MESTNKNSITFLSKTVTETIFTNLVFSRRVYVNPIEFNENPRNGLVADTTSQPDGNELDIRRLMCTSHIWESHSRNGASSLLCMMPCRLSYTLLAVGARVRKVSTEHTHTNVVYLFQKRPHWLQLWLYSKYSKCFWNRHNPVCS